MSRARAVGGETRAAAMGVVVVLSWAVESGPASAQVAFTAPKLGQDDNGLSSLGPALSKKSINAKHTREYEGLPAFGWMLYPSLLVGGIYDDNIYQSSIKRVSAGGLHLRPIFVAERDTGIHDTRVYANGDLRIYPDRSAGNLVNAQGGLVHVWRAAPDLAFRFRGEFDRYTDMFNSGVVATQTLGLSTALGVQASPQRYNQYIVEGSGIKSFDRLFLGLGAGSIGSTYDTFFTTTGPISQSFRNNIITGVTGRIGYMLTPLLYGYLEPSGNFRDFNSSVFNSTGYRIVGGLGTDRISLFRFEAFAGYQKQFYDSQLFGSPGMPVVGARVFWYPTRYINVSTTVDEYFQDSGLSTVGNLTGSSARVVSAVTTVDYALSRSWTASVRGGYGDVNYIAGIRHDHRWIAGAQVNYQIWRNINATCEYDFVNVSSNVVGASFTRNMITLGVTYRY